MSLFGKIGSFLGNPGKFFGTNNLIGGAINDVTGVSDSARQQYKYNQALQADAQDFNAQQAQLERDWQTQMSNTARQRAVSDLQSAGLNPVLATGAEASSGAGAAATSPGVSTGAGISSGNPISMITELVNASNNTARTEAEVKNINADTNMKEQLFEWTPKLNKSIIDYQSAQSGKARAEALTEFEKQLALTLENKLTAMDVEKRAEFFEKEKELYEAQIKADLVKMGFEGDPAVKAVERAFETVGKVFGGSSSENHNYSYNESHHTGKSTTTIKHKY